MNMHGKKHTHKTHDSVDSGPDTSVSPHSKSRLVLLGVLLVAQLMVILDITAVNIALPSLASDLQLSGSTVSWTITSYSLVFGSLLLFGGRLADLIGRRRMFLTGLGIFTVSSVASAVAGTAAALFAARAGQGLGAALLSPAALSIITTAFQGPMRAKALAAWGAVGGAGAAIGVLVGGVLTEVADWRLIFYVNIPVAIGLAVAALKVIPRDDGQAALAWPRRTRRRPRHRQPRHPRLRDHPGRSRRLGLNPDDRAHDTRTRRSRRLRSLGAPDREAAAAGRAARRPRRRRRPLPDDRRRWLALRALPPLLPLPPERPRHEPAHDRPRLPPARSRSRTRRPHRRAHRRTPRRPDAPRLGIPDHRDRHGTPRPRDRERHLPSQRAPRDARRRLRPRDRDRLGLDRDPHRRERGRSQG